MDFADIPVQTDHLWTNAYYYVDDVILSPDSNYADSLMSVAQLKINNYELRVYPNPSNGKFNIVVSDKEQAVGEMKVEVYNMLGEKVYTAPLNYPHIGGISVTTISLPNGEGQGGAGIYMYRVITETGKLLGEGKLVIMR